MRYDVMQGGHWLCNLRADSREHAIERCQEECDEHIEALDLDNKEFSAVEAE